MSRAIASVLTVRPGPYLEAGWEATLSAFDAVSLKVCNGAGVWTTTPKPIAQAVDAAGLPLWGWGYHYLSRWRKSGGTWVAVYSSDVTDAIAEGKAAGEACKLWGCSTYSANVEHEAFGAWGAPATKDVNQAARAFAESFRTVYPSGRLVWNGILWERYLATDGSWRTGLTADGVSSFDAVQPELYKLGPDTAAQREKVAATWDESRAKADRWAAPWWAMVASGESRSNGEAWSFHFDKDKAPGLVTLCGRHRPRVLCWFYGSGSSPMLTLGSKVNAALRRVPPWLRQAWSEGEAFAGTAAHPEMTPGAGV